MRVGSVWSNFDQHPTVLGLHHQLEVLKLRLYWNVQWSRHRVTVPDIHQCVWSRSAHTSQVDVQLNSTMHLISGTLRSIPFPLLPVLSYIEPPAHYEGRLPLTSWRRKSSNMTVGQSRLISLAHHCYDLHPGSRCG